MRLSHLITLCNRIAPETLAEEWDHVGLQCGDPEAEVSKLLLCLDLTDAVLAEARALDAECILSHHPLLFRPVLSLREDRYPARLLADLIRSGIAAYAMHTDLDSARPGTSDGPAEALGIVETEPLVPAARPGAPTTSWPSLCPFGCRPRSGGSGRRRRGRFGQLLAL